MFLILAIFLSACSTYRVPSNNAGVAAVMGGVITSEEGESRSIFRVSLIDGKPAQTFNNPYAGIDYYRTQQYPVEAGTRQLTYQFVVTAAEGFHNRGQSHVFEAALLPGKTYRASGVMLNITVLKFWLEDLETGEIVSPVFYSPDNLDHTFEQQLAKDPPDVEYAILNTSEFGFFANKRFLSPGKDCINLWRETMYDPGAYGLAQILGGVPGGSIPQANYIFEAYPDICFEPASGHTYEFRTKKIRSPNPGWDILIELWDTTDDALIQSFRPEDIMQQESQ